MKKYWVFATALLLTLTLSACRSMDNTGDTGDTGDATNNTMPTVITTLPTTEQTVPETSYRPDDDGFIDGTDGTDANDTTDTTENNARMRIRRRK